MEDERKKQGGGAAIALAGAALMLVLVLYLLSSGPAVWLLNHGHIPGNTYQTIYGPLYGLAQRFDATTAALDIYLNIWR